MKQPALEAVIIASPTQVHAKQAEQAMRAGKHVLIEIPIADSVADSERLVSVQQQTGVVGMAGHVRRFNPSHHSHISRFGQYTLDLSRTPPPVDYHLPIELADDLMVHVVGLDDLIRLKSASGLNAHRARKIFMTRWSGRNPRSHPRTGSAQLKHPLAPRKSLSLQQLAYVHPVVSLCTHEAPHDDRDR